MNNPSGREERRRITLHTIENVLLIFILYIYIIPGIVTSTILLYNKKIQRPPEIYFNYKYCIYINTTIIKYI